MRRTSDVQGAVIAAPSRLSRRARKLLLAVHVIVSVSWLGTAYATVVLAVVAAVAGEWQRRAVTYALIQTYDLAVLLPFGLAALLSGVALAQGTRLGLLTHYWVATKLALTVTVLVGALFLRGGFVSAAVSAAPAPDPGGLDPVEIRVLVGSIVAMAGLTTVALIGMYRPWGRTRLAGR